MLRPALAALAALLVLASPAAAITGDPLPAPVTPANGATVAANPDGITFTFTCPAYRSSPSEEAPNPDIGGYAVRVSRDPSGAGDFASSSATRVAGDQCTGTVKSYSGSDAKFETTPGTYYWFVDRTCYCENGAQTERGPVSSFTVSVGAAKLTTVAPKRAYAGYTIRAALQTDLADGSEVQLQRKAGSAWQAVTSAVPIRVSKGKADTEVTLPKGKQQLRWVATRGTQTDAGAPATVTVVKARKWRTSRRADGRYAGPSTKNQLAFRVAKGGRELRDFKASVSTFCIGGLDPATNRIVVSFARVKRIKVAPDGRFLTVANVSKTTAIVSGRLRNGKVTGGKIELSYPLCSGSRTFKASKR